MPGWNLNGTDEGCCTSAASALNEKAGILDTAVLEVLPCSEVLVLVADLVVDFFRVAFVVLLALVSSSDV